MATSVGIRTESRPRPSRGGAASAGPDRRHGTRTRKRRFGFGLLDTPLTVAGPCPHEMCMCVRAEKKAKVQCERIRIQSMVSSLLVSGFGRRLLLVCLFVNEWLAWFRRLLISYAWPKMYNRQTQPIPCATRYTHKQSIYACLSLFPFSFPQRPNPNSAGRPTNCYIHTRPKTQPNPPPSICKSRPPTEGPPTRAHRLRRRR